jgi:hypothetical protein
MKFLIKLFCYFLFTTKLFAADFIMNCSGVDKFPRFIKIDESNNFLIYSNQFQCTTNTSMIVYGTADGIVETVDGVQREVIMNIINDKYGNVGYLKVVPTKVQHYRENDGDYTGASINTWQWVGGNGPFAELKGVIMTGAYLQLGKNVHDGGNFLWKGTASGISDKIIKAISSYTKKEEE